MKILVTGAGGFLGKNLVCNLKNAGYDEVFSYDISSTEEEFNSYTEQCDFVFHLAGVNRPKDPREFVTGNAGLTEKLINRLKECGNKVPILLSSSIQAGLNNDYGKSKREAEELVFSYGRDEDVPVYVYRFPNLFGKWSRPNYNTVIATFCHNIARDLPIRIDDREHVVSLAYVDDVIGQFLRILKTGIRLPAGEFVTFPPNLIYERKLGYIADTILSFKKSREDLMVPDMGDEFVSKLYSTYLSFLPEEGFSYPLKKNSDQRGSFTEFLKSADRGQVSVNVSHPGITKGQHWHNSKNEKFLVVSGRGRIEFRKIGTDEVITYHLSGDKPEVVDIPTGYTHNIINEGDTDLVTVMWANEVFDPEHPDTFYETV